jgi:putative Mg2+ transporter-C (MgtC) family protein
VSASELEVLARAFLAGLLGYIVGFEREYIAHREAGTSTFGLIAMSAALVTALSLNVFGIEAGSRVVANIMVGVGFLGGGTILKEAQRIKGLTTAAGIWGMASVGMVIGTGQYVLGIAASLLVLVLFALGHLESFVAARFQQGRERDSDEA